MGFLWLLTNPRIMADDALRDGEAWHLLESFRKDERIVFTRDISCRIRSIHRIHSRQVRSRHP
jgi:hypothetical protein